MIRASLAASWILGILVLFALAASTPIANAQGTDNLASLVVPPRDLPDYQIVHATTDESGQMHMVVYGISEPAAAFSIPFVVLVGVVDIGQEPTVSGADFLFAMLVEGLVQGMLTETTDAHFEAFDGPVVAPTARWTRLETVISDQPVEGFLVAFPWERGMVMVGTLGFFESALPEDVAALGTAAAIRVGAVAA